MIFLISQMSNAIENAIAIDYNGESINMFPINGKIKVKTLQQFFPNATGLAYDKDGETFGLHEDENGFIELKLDVKSYYLFNTDTRFL